MNYTRSAVYTKIAEAIGAKYPKAYVTGRYVSAPAAFPAVFVREIERSRTQRNITLDFGDSQYKSTFEVQVFSNKKSNAMAEAYDIMEIIEGTFNSLYYIEDMCEALDNEKDNTIFRLAARFHRQICGGDTLPEK